MAGFVVDSDSEDVDRSLSTHSKNIIRPKPVNTPKTSQKNAKAASPQSDAAEDSSDDNTIALPKKKQRTKEEPNEDDEPVKLGQISGTMASDNNQTKKKQVNIFELMMSKQKQSAVKKPDASVTKVEEDFPKQEKQEEAQQNGKDMTTDDSTRDNIKTDTSSRLSQLSQSEGTGVRHNSQHSEDDDHNDDDETTVAVSQSTQSHSQSQSQSQSQNVSKPAPKKQMQPFFTVISSKKAQPSHEDNGVDDAGSSSSSSSTSLVNDFGAPNFDPTHVSWKKGQKIPYAALCEMFAKCEATTKRLAIISYVRDFFRSVILLSPEQLLKAVYMCINQVAPAFEGKELGIGDSILERAVSEAVGTTASAIKERVKAVGDLGEVANESRGKQSTLFRPKALIMEDVFDKMKRMTEITGKNSNDQKRDIIKSLIVSGRNEEPKFIVRAFQGNLRIRLALQTVLRSLAEAVVLTPPIYPQIGTKKSVNSNNTATVTSPTTTTGATATAPDLAEIEQDLEEALEDEFEIHGADEEELADAYNDENDDDSTDDSVDDDDEHSERSFTTKNDKLTPLEKRMKWAHHIVESAYNDGPTIDRLVNALLTYPLKELKKQCMLTPGIPIKVMLGKPGTGIQQTIDKFTSEFENQFKTSKSSGAKPSSGAIHKFITKSTVIDDENDEDDDPNTSSLVAPAAGPTSSSSSSQQETTPGDVANQQQQQQQNDNGAPQCQLTWEYKYDGERAQIHMLPDGTIRVYSRHMENYTSKYPDVIANIRKVLHPSTTSFILDSEIVAWDADKERILPFQVLSTRKRKDVSESDIKVPVQIYGFDLLYLNGKSYMREDFLTRRTALHQAFLPQQGIFKFSEYTDSTDPAQIEAFLFRAVEDCCEGLMVKPLHKGSFYVPDKRKWIKIKKDYMDGVGDTLDLIPLAAWAGKGKRTGFYGSFLLFSYDRDELVYQSMSKVGTGFKDEDMARIYNTLKEYEIDEPPDDYVYDKSGTDQPDVWFQPKVVWEIKCADLTVSPEYMTAFGQVHDKSGRECGISMRFPRFVRERPDKTVEASTSSAQACDMYFAQSYTK